MEITQKDSLFDEFDLRNIWLLVGIGILIRLVFITSPIKFGNKRFACKSV